MILFSCPGYSWSGSKFPKRNFRVSMERDFRISISDSGQA